MNISRHRAQDDLAALRGMGNAGYCRDIYENAGADAWLGENVEATRDLMAKLLGAQPGELAFMKNTTEGLNIEARALHAIRRELAGKATAAA